MKSNLEKRLSRAMTLLLLANGAVACGGGDGAGDASTDADGDTDTDGDGDTDGDTDTEAECVPADEQPWLEPADIGFAEVSAPLVGSFVYYGVWGGAGTDSLEMMATDGSEEATRFTVHRMWSFGVAADGETIAFSSGDPLQEEHFCLTVGDAIQHTWLWRPGTDPQQITTGRVNDECHLFGPGGQRLYLCRRAGFWQQSTEDGFEFGSDPYRILAHDLESGEETWLTDLDPVVSDIGPALRDDGSLLFWRQEPAGTGFVQWLMSMNDDGSDASYLVESGTNPVTNPQGTAVLFRQAWKSIRVGDSHAPGAAAELIPAADGNVYDYAFSPDQTRIAFTRGRLDASCSDIWIADVATATEERLVDCVVTGRFITGIAWLETQEKK
jgi:hypothetical protein